MKRNGIFDSQKLLIMTESIFNKRLTALRSEMNNAGIDAYILPRTDPHNSEYLPDYFESVAWLTGFSGSAANVVVTNNFAGLWTDSRYFLQAEDQLANSGVELVKLKIPHTPQYIDWLVNNLPNASKLGVDGRLLQRSRYQLLCKKLENKNITIIDDLDLISPLWDDRPVFPASKAFDFDIMYCGKSRKEKLTEVREEMKGNAADVFILTSLDDIAWLYNIRGKDLSHMPVVVSYAVVAKNNAYLFIKDSKIDDSLKKTLQQDGIDILPYEKVEEFIKNIPSSSTVLADLSKISQWIYKLIPNNCLILDDMDITTWNKAVKNDVELANFKKAMVKDGVALTKFAIWLEENLGKIKITEISASKKLLSFRAEQDAFFSASFGSIAGYKGHGAIVHYSATEKSDAELKPEGIFLLDSGGQYFEGTTDITRTFSLGNPTREEINDFTLVLKGHIQLAMLKFPIGTKGNQVDIMARQSMWQQGINYGHGTGHGIGFFLGVHEGPNSIGTAAAAHPKAYLAAGMVLTNEPGIYREGKHGIRTENVLQIVEAEETEFGKFLKFETITLFPIELDLVNSSMLTKKEKEWLNDYHKKVYDKLNSLLDKKEQAWLMQKTKQI